MTSERTSISHFETTIDAGDFELRSRTMQIRFQLDDKHFGQARRQIFLKCVANIEQIPNMKRQTSEFAYIQSDDLQNLRLINSQSLGECDASCYWSSLRNAILCSVLIFRISEHWSFWNFCEFSLQNRQNFSSHFVERSMLTSIGNLFKYKREAQFSVANDLTWLGQ